jgi:hypothetical protein
MSTAMVIRVQELFRILHSPDRGFAPRTLHFTSIRKLEMADRAYQLVLFFSSNGFVAVPTADETGQCEGLTIHWPFVTTGHKSLDFCIFRF